MRSVQVVLLAIVTAVTALAGPSATTRDNAEVERGEFLFRTSCVSCHGPAGRGDGPMERVLEVDVPDLTVLSARNGGEFPAPRIERLIDGRDELASHGSRRMPIWGLTFQQLDQDTNQEQEIQNRIRAVVRYLETLQRKD